MNIEAFLNIKKMNNKIFKLLSILIFSLFFLFLSNKILFALSGTISVDSKDIQVGQSFNINITGENQGGLTGLFIYRNFNRNSSAMLAQFSPRDTSKTTRSVAHSESSPGIYKYCGFVEGYGAGYKIVGSETSPGCIDVPIGVEKDETTNNQCICECDLIPISVSLFVRKEGDIDWVKEIKANTGEELEFLAIITKKTEEKITDGNFLVLPERNLSFIDYSQIMGIKDLDEIEREELIFSARVNDGEEKSFELESKIKSDEFESNSWVKIIRENVEGVDNLPYSYREDFCMCDCSRLPISVFLSLRKKGDENWARSITAKTGDVIEFLAVIRRKESEELERGNFLILPENNLNFLDYGKVVGIKDFKDREREDIVFSAELLEGEDQEFKIEVVIKADEFENNSFVNITREDPIEKELTKEIIVKEESDSIFSSWWFWGLILIIFSVLSYISFNLFSKKREQDNY